MQLVKESAAERKLALTRKRCEYWAGVAAAADAEISKLTGLARTTKRAALLAEQRRRKRDAARRLERFSLLRALQEAEVALSRARTPKGRQAAAAARDAAQQQIDDRRARQLEKDEAARRLVADRISAL